MMQMLEANWQVFAALALAVLLIAWWLLSRAGKGARNREYQPDVLDEGVGPAQRNQALIDSAPAAHVVLPPAASSALGGLGEIVAVAAQDTVEEARAAEPAPAPPPPPPAPMEVPPPPTQPEIAPAAPEPEAVPPAPEPAAPSAPQARAPVAATEPAPQPEQPGELPEEMPQPDTGPPPGPEPLPEQPVGGADDLARIKGLGPKLQTLLPTLGITTFAQIAAFSDADLANLDGKLGPFAGRPARDGWVEQAKYLASGDVAGFEARFGKV